MIKFFETYVVSFSSKAVLNKLKLKNVFAGGNFPYWNNKKPCWKNVIDNQNKSFVVQKMLNFIDATYIIQGARGQFSYIVVESYGRVDPDTQIF